MSKAKDLGRAFEQRVVAKANKHGIPARRQPGSGVHAAYPKDVVLAEAILVECKVRSATLNARGARILALDLDWLEGVQRAAIKDGFAQGIVIANAKGSRKPVVLCDLDFLLAILHSVKVLTNE